MARTDTVRRPPDHVLASYAPAVRELVLYLCNHPAKRYLDRAIELDREDCKDPHKPWTEWTDGDAADAWRVVRHEAKHYITSRPMESDT